MFFGYKLAKLFFQHKSYTFILYSIYESLRIFRFSFRKASLASRQMSAIKCAGLWPKSAVQITPTLFLCTGRPRARTNFCCTQLDVPLRALAMYSSVCHSSSQCVSLVTITLNCHSYRYHWLNDFFLYGVLCAKV